MPSESANTAEARRWYELQGDIEVQQVGFISRDDGKTGTVMEDSRIPLRTWCHAYWRAASSKKGVSALQIKRETGISYKSALFLMHRIRWAMSGVSEDDGEERGKPGPQPDRLKIDVPFEEGLRRALKKEKPEEGWPEPEEPQPDNGS